MEWRWSIIWCKTVSFRFVSLHCTGIFCRATQKSILCAQDNHIDQLVRNLMITHCFIFSFSLPMFSPSLLYIYSQPTPHFSSLWIFNQFFSLSILVCYLLQILSEKSVWLVLLHGWMLQVDNTRFVHNFTFCFFFLCFLFVLLLTLLWFDWERWVLLV